MLGLDFLTLLVLILEINGLDGSSLKCFEENPSRFSGRKISYCAYFPVQNPKVCYMKTPLSEIGDVDRGCDFLSNLGDFDADDLNSSGAPQCSKVSSTEGDGQEHEVCICNNSLCNYSNGAEKQELFDARPASSPDKGATPLREIPDPLVTTKNPTQIPTTPSTPFIESSSTTLEPFLFGAGFPTTRLGRRVQSPSPDRSRPPPLVRLATTRTPPPLVTPHLSALPEAEEGEGEFGGPNSLSLLRSKGCSNFVPFTIVLHAFHQMGLQITF
ncbi:hypothetical protein TCAL_11705 [Tigriopus californicus]|uniref:Activin types I and II receptor domain-containing protein n=1 Tax=Tigriopus californicus TaxID=6832 RepID=A0A553NAU8_TIGCA|nr:uncharacterized protein LOC131889713 [Tigriopus californicus]TRY62563.1 hypothetical protein TCAL_11705 [Tigriopus californicus]